MRRRPPPTAVAVPACNEAETIGACLSALLDQRDLTGSPLPSGDIKIVVLANNCTDATAEIARGFGEAVEVLDLALPAPAANAGTARRMAMDAAAARLPRWGGLICTTDADSRPRRDWIAQLWRAVDAGAGAVAGVVDFDFAPGHVPVFSEARRRESLYSALQAEIIAHVDPEAHNPWPNHIWAWGANLAVTAQAYRRVGGLPARPLAEDRAFVDALRLHDVPVRHCLSARVWTSPRPVGRAQGGLASLVADHTGQDCSPCDAALEPAREVWRRAAWRRRLRRAYADGRLAPAVQDRLGLKAEVLAEALRQPTFGAAWSLVEAASPRFRARRLSPGDLPHEVRRARRLLDRLRPTRDGADPPDRLHAASAGLWSAPPPPP